MMREVVVLWGRERASTRFNELLPILGAGSTGQRNTRRNSLHCNGMQMRTERPRRFAFAFFGLRFTLSLRAGCCVDRMRPPRFEEMTPETGLPDSLKRPQLGHFLEFRWIQEVDATLLRSRQSLASMG
jgi:hypothetical protein